VLSVAHSTNKKVRDLPTTSIDVQHDVEICYQKEKHDVKEVCVCVCVCVCHYGNHFDNSISQWKLIY
jgi:hypothetical protein